MKTAKGKSSKKAGTAKAGSGAREVEKYIASAPGPAKRKLKEMRGAIRSALPRGASEVISYRIPAFRLEGTVVWYAAFAEHCSLFPTAAVIGQFEKELAGYNTSKGTIQFPLDKPLPVALIKRIVRARVAQMEGERGRKKRKY